MIEFDKNTAVVFPGQGSQIVGMGADLYESSEEAKNIFKEVNQTLDRNLSDIIFSGSQEQLNKTENAQPAITATSLAATKAFTTFCAEPFGLSIIGSLIIKFALYF